MTDQQNWNGGEGCLGESWTKTRAAFHAPALEQLMMAKAHDTALQAGHDPWDCRQPMRSLTCVQKRSYKRAYRRSLRNGSAWYRGRCLLLEQFPSCLDNMPRPAAPRDRQQKCKAPHFAPRHRLQVGHINVGGLAKERLQEIQLWAVDNELDIMILSETRWSFNSEWENPTWYLIHTGTPKDRSDGLLFLIRKHFATLIRSDLRK
jgi:hypothetical protein